MKKVFTLSMIVLFAFHASAQFTKGNKVLGFGVGFQRNMQEQTFNPVEQMVKTNSLSLSLQLGFARSNSRLNGFYLNTGYGKTTTEISAQPSSMQKNQNINFRTGYFVRHYVPLGNKFYVYGEGSAGVFYGSTYSARLSDPNQQNFGGSISVNPGLAYKIKDRFLLELRFDDLANISFSQHETETAFDNKTITRNFNIGSGLGLGYLNSIGIGARWIIK